MSAERRARVLEILRAATEPIGPTEIARRIGEPWCVKMFGVRASGSPQSNAINPLLATLVSERTVEKLPKGLYRLSTAPTIERSSAMHATGAVTPSAPRGRR